HRLRADRRGCPRCPPPRYVKPPPFAYARATSVEHALELLAEGGGDAKPIAGGQSLLPALAYRLVRPTPPLGLGFLRDLDYVLNEQDGLRLGALVRHRALAAEDWDARWRGLVVAARHIGHDAIRVRGTIGGSLVHADPAAELPVAVLALGGELALRGQAGMRVVDVDTFFLAPFTTVVGVGELLLEVRLQAPPPGARTAFAEFAPRSGDFATACVFAGLGSGWSRITVGGVGGVAARA